MSLQPHQWEIQTMLKQDLCLVSPLGLTCRGLLHWGGGIHAVPFPAGQREAGSLHRVAADQAAAP